jgi:hypothetical protein
MVICYHLEFCVFSCHRVIRFPQDLQCAPVLDGTSLKYMNPKFLAVPVSKSGRSRQKGARNDRINSAAGMLLSGYYHTILIIQPIRQFDNPFIPLFFHWSKRLIKPQSVETLRIHDCYTCWFCNTPIMWIWTGNYTISFPRFSFGILIFVSKIKFYLFICISPVEYLGSFMAGRDLLKKTIKEKLHCLSRVSLIIPS